MSKALAWEGINIIMSDSIPVILVGFGQWVRIVSPDDDLEYLTQLANQIP